MRLSERHLLGIALAVLLAITVPPESRAADGVTIHAHDVVIDPVVSNTPKSVIGPGKIASRNRTVALTAFGSRLLLDLQPNDRLVSGVLADLRHSGNAPQIYQGSLKSRPETWARIAIDDDGNLSGVIWDGADLLILDQASRLYGASGYPGSPKDTLAVRGSDIQITVADGYGQTGGQAVERLDKLFTASSLSFSTDQVSSAISLGLVLDNEYVGNAPSKTIQRAIELTNIADGIFTSQLGIHINIEHIKAYDNETTDPFTKTNPSGLLDQLTTLKKNDPVLSTMGLVHMFTQINLDGETRGIARLASLCAKNEGTGLTEGRGSTIDALIMAHEIGHNFGAMHDGVSGEGCSTTPANYLMAPKVNGSAVFSQCSVDRMQQTLSSASCLANIPTSEISVAAPVLPATVLYGERIPFEYVVTNEGVESTLDSALIVSTADAVAIRGNGSPDRTCGDAGPQSSHRCDLTSLYAGESVTIGYSMEARQLGQIYLDAAVTASNDTNPDNNYVRSSVEVLTATDLASRGETMAWTDSNIRAGESINFTATGMNKGDFDSVSHFRISTAPNHNLSSSDGCTVLNHYTLNCDLGSVPAGGDRSVDFVVHSDPTLFIDPAENIADVVRLEIKSSVPDVVPTNNTVYMSFSMWGTFMDLYAEFVEPPVSVGVGETRKITAVYGNSGPDFVPGVTATVRSVTAGIYIDNVSVENGTCARHSDERVDCEIGDLESGQTVALEATFTASEPGSHKIQVDSRVNYGLDINVDNNLEAVEITVLAPPSPQAQPEAKKQASGGGSMSLLSLLVLLLFSRRLYHGQITCRGLIQLHVAGENRR